jgi:hypothetical protein
MEKKTVRVMKWFMAWQDDREEAWLEEMARAGLHLKKYKGFGIYTFEVGTPREDVYRLDYITVSGKEREQYLQLFADAGWEHVNEAASWQYYRKPRRADSRDEIFCDNMSKIEKYRRLMALYIPLGVVMWININTIHRKEGLLFEILVMFLFLMGAFFVGSLIMIWRRIEALKRQ